MQLAIVASVILSLTTVTIIYCDLHYNDIGSQTLSLAVAMRESIFQLLFSKWLWIIILGGIACLLLGFVVVYMILVLPPPWRGLFMIGIVIGWGVVAGYKDWRLFRSKEEQVKWHAGKEESARSI